MSARLAAVAGLLPFLSVTAAAEDSVFIDYGSRGTVEMRGTILEYNGRQLRLQRASGQPQAYPSERVVRFETELGEQHRAGDEALAANRFADALAHYRLAYGSEQRTWVRRMLLSNRAWCHRGLGQWEQAAETFLLMVASDPQTLYADAIPLAWQPGEFVRLETAQRWFDRSENPWAVLLGASHLMSGNQRTTALRALGELSRSGDPRLAALAAAQQWRARAFAADDREIGRWQQALEGMPEKLRAGPYFVIGRAQLAGRDYAAAALSLLRVPILYEQHYQLSAAALLGAGDALATAGQTDAAGRLYAEVVRDYDDTPAAPEARRAWEELQPSRSPR